MSDNPEHPRLPVASQWQERRAFQRLYFKNPQAQSRFVMTLLNFRATQTEFTAEPDRDEELIGNIDGVISSFVELYPECMEEHVERDAFFEMDEYTADENFLLAVSEVIRNG